MLKKIIKTQEHFQYHSEILANTIKEVYPHFLDVCKIIISTVFGNNLHSQIIIRFLISSTNIIYTTVNSHAVGNCRFSFNLAAKSI
jgi:hypothetical protein